MVELRKLCRLSPSDLHQLLEDRCRQEQLRTAARDEWKAGRGLEKGG